MAEINTNGSGSKNRRGGQRSKKLSTRVDLTPMVDLGFLLITFFIFTTTMSENKAMRIAVPANPQDLDSLLLPESGVLTIIPINHDSIYYYEGKDPSKGAFVSDRLTRSVIMKKKSLTNAAKFIVVLKPSPQCHYRNVVSMLDEMLICDVHHYVMTDAAPADLIAVNIK